MPDRAIGRKILDATRRVKVIIPNYILDKRVLWVDYLTTEEIPP